MSNEQWLSIFLIASFSSYLCEQGCIPGETWYENCSKCKCYNNENISCTSGDCFKHECIIGTVVFDENYRCHCKTRHGKANQICVSLSEQKDLNNQTCSPFSYFYDTCNFCACNPKNNKTQCSLYQYCLQTKGGVCNKGDIIYENCFKCQCTHTNFRICEYQKDCGMRKTKTGRCKKRNKMINAISQLACLLLLQHECYTDYGCPGNKKCCSVSNCYLKCVDPV